MLEIIISVAIVIAAFALMFWANEKLSLDRRLQKSSQEGTPEEQKTAQEIQRQINQGRYSIDG